MSSYEDLKNNFKQRVIAEEIAPPEQQTVLIEQDPDVYNSLVRALQAESTRARALEKELGEKNVLIDECIKVLDLFKERVIPVPVSRLRGPVMFSDGSEFIYVAIGEKEEVKWVKSGREIEKEQERTQTERQ